MIPKISVLIPIYNQGEYIRRCLDSVVGQSLKEIEIICVDDGSSDDSVKIVAEYAENDQRIRLIKHGANKSTFMARKTGIFASRGEYVMFVDPDDWITSDACADLYSEIKKYDADILHFNAVEVIDFNGITAAKSESSFLHTDLTCAEGSLILGVYLKNHTVWNKICRTELCRKAAETVENEYINIGDDLYLTSALYLFAEKYVSIPQKYYYYYDRKSGMTARNDNSIEKVENLTAIPAIMRDIRKMFSTYALKGEWEYIYDKKVCQQITYCVDIYENDLPDSKKQEAYEILCDCWGREAIDAEIERRHEVRISVIIPVYNTEKYLEECLDTILDQSMSQFEVICVDDGSTDRSPEILREYEKLDDRVTVLTQKNRFAGAARNTGLRSARGEYVIFLDSDDYFDSDLLNSLYENAEKNNADISVCDARKYIDTSGVIEKNCHYVRKKYLPETEPFSYKTNAEYIFNFATPSIWKMLFRRKFLIDNGIMFQEIKTANDVSFFGKAMMKAASIVTTNRQLITYRIRQGSLQREKDDTCMDFYYALIELRNEIERTGMMQKLKSSFMNLVLEIYFYNMYTSKSKDNFTALHKMLLNEAERDFGLDDLNYSDINDRSCRERYERHKNMPLESILADVFPEDVEAEPEIINRRSEQTPLVSVIVPVYNTERYISCCLESIVRQTLKEIEIICINDGSTDGSLDILKQYARKDSRLMIINQENKGVSKARNAGLAAAKGQYVLFVDSDDYIDTETAEEIYARCISDGLEVLITDITAVCYDQNDERLRQETEEKNRYYHRTGRYAGVRSGPEMMSSMIRMKDFRSNVTAMAFSRRFLLDNDQKFLEGIIHEDELFSFQAMLWAKRTGYEKKSYYHREMRDGSIVTSPISVNNFIGYYTCYAEMLKTLNAFEQCRQIDPAVMCWLWKTINKEYYSADKIYRKLHGKETIKFAASPSAAAMYEIYRHSIKKEKKRIKKIRKIKKSYRYRIGRIIVFISGKIREYYNNIAKGGAE